MLGIYNTFGMLRIVKDRTLQNIVSRMWNTKLGDTYVYTDNQILSAAYLPHIFYVVIIFMSNKETVGNVGTIFEESYDESAVVSP